MMRFDAWTPVYLATTLVLVGACLSFFIPETLHSQSAPFDGAFEAAAITGEKTPLISSFPENILDRESYTVAETPKRSMWQICYSNFQDAIGVAFQDRRIFTILATFPLHVISRSTMKFLLQYVTQRYSWTMAQAGFLNSLRASVNIVLLVVILPLATKLLLGKLGLSNMRKDLSLAKASMLLLTIGSFTIAASPTIALLTASLITYTLGTGFALFIRSLATSLVEPDQVGRLYSAMTVFDAFGQMTAGPILAELFHIGIKRGKVFSGLPFLVGGVFHGLVLAVLWLIKLPGQDESHAGAYVLIQEPEVVV
jgi:hypothetical protein